MATITGTSGNDSLTGTSGSDTIDGLGGSDTMTGGAGDDLILGGAGEDIILMSRGGAASYGNDTIDGGDGLEDKVEFGSDVASALVVDLAAGTISGGGQGGAGSATLTGIERVVAGAFDDRVSGDSQANYLDGRRGNDTLFGAVGNDTLLGRDGNDRLEGGGGNDTLTGHAGQDSFVFADSPSAANVDLITDFAPGPDQLVLDNAAFGALGANGDFSSGDVRFWAAPGATSGHDATDRIIYNTSTGNLYYDADGSGPGAAQLIATLQGNPALVATDVTVISSGSGGGGTAGDDSLVGTEGNDTLDGGAGNDTLRGLGGNDSLIGGIGSDLLDGGAGVDTMDGGTGDDTYIVLSLFNPPEDMLIDAGGVDTIIVNGDGSGAVLPEGFENVTVRGTGFEVESGIGGNDADNIIRNETTTNLMSISGRGGNDTLIGGVKDDWFDFSDAYGDDVVDGGGGDFDLLVFERGGPVVADFRAGTASGGGTGSVAFSNVEGIIAGQFDDLLIASDAGINLYANGGNDTLVGGAGNDFLGDDIEDPDHPAPGLKTGNDQISGGAGDDFIRVGRGNDSVDAGTGNDFILIESDPFSYDHDVIVGGDGVDTVMIFGVDDVLADLAAGTVTGGGGEGAEGSAELTGIENFTAQFVLVTGPNGTESATASISGSTAANYLRGYEGDDSLNGRAGNDTLEGQAGADRFIFDQAAGASNADVIVDFASASDTLELDAAVMPALGQPGRFAAGDARFFAGPGATSGQDASDRVIYNTSNGELRYDADGSGSGAGLLIATLQGAPTLAASDIVISGNAGPGPEPIQGTDGHDALTGTAGDDVLEGLGGSDTITGLAGNDTIRGGSGEDIILMSRGGAASYGSDVIDGGEGLEDKVEFGSDVTSDLVVDLAAGTITGGGQGGAGSATVTNVERLVAGAFNDRVTGSGAAEYLDGRRGNDTVSGGAGNDTLLGRDGNDRLEGGSGNDTLTGHAGQDSFVFADVPSAANVDRITDFAPGPDQLVLDKAAFTAIGATGDFSSGDARFWAAPGVTSGHDTTDRIVYNTTTGNLYYDADGSGAGAAQLIATLQGAPTLSATDIAVFGEASSGTTTGTEGDDTLIGTEGNDALDALGGNDVLEGRGGDDTLQGGSGNDAFRFSAASGNYGHDQVDGGTGVDRLELFGAQSRVFVDLAAGTMTGGGEAGSGSATLVSIEVVQGGAFDDQLTAGATGATLVGNGGSDVLFGGAGNDTLAGEGNVVTGNSGNDQLFGGEGDDVLEGGDGRDHLEGNGDNDRFTDTSFDGDFLDGGPGVDTFEVAIFADGFVVDLENERATFQSTATTLVFIENVVMLADNGDDVLIGSSSANFLAGNGGFDTLNGGAGNDTLAGEADADDFIFDQAPGAANADTIIGFATNSDDIVLSRDAMPALGTAGSFASGDARFFAEPGATSGRDGGDRVVYDTSTGNLYYDPDGSGAAGAQLIATLQGAPTLAASDIVVSGEAGPTPIRGTEGNDSLTGTAGDDVIEGLGGNDTLSGLAGADTLQGGAGSDTFNLGAAYGNDVIDGGAGTDKVEFGPDVVSAVDIDLAQSTITGGGEGGAGNATVTNVERAIGGAFNDRMVGTDGENYLDGRRGSDRIFGLGGDDTLLGRDGDDFLVGGMGNDTLTGGAGIDAFLLGGDAPGAANADRITDFASGTDELWLSKLTLTAIGPSGEFAAGDERFWAAPGATRGHDATDRIVYDTATGSLYYDADGSGSGDAQLLGTFQGNPTIAASDFIVVS